MSQTPKSRIAITFRMVQNKATEKDFIEGGQEKRETL